jgi:ribA/ribD-fused uncharacterized protein
MNVFDAPQVIHFYSVSDAYGEFSDFSPHSITLDSERWPTSEHYFQAQKFEDESKRQEIRCANRPMLPRGSGVTAFLVSSFGFSRLRG